MTQNPGGQQPASQPYPAQPDARPAADRRSFVARHKVLTTLGALVVLGIVVSVAGGGGQDQTAGSASVPAVEAAAGTADAAAPDDAAAAPAAEPPAAEPPAAGIGTTVADGSFEFTVTQVEAGVPSLGTAPVSKQAQGTFVLVHMHVRNVGNDAQYFDGSSQTLVDTQGRRHSADSGAAIYLGDTESFLNQINPGNEVDGIVVFDVPADAQPASMELHDSPFSGGATVRLS